MKCPKCKTEVAEHINKCPNCNTIIKLRCPNCGILSTKSVCSKCGTVLLNKCYKCGTLNLVENKKCSKCGMDIEASIGLKESVIEEFAALTIEITNYDEIKEAFKSEKIKEQFRKNLYSLIKHPANQKKLRVQIIDNSFIIRFNKNYSYAESCISAIDFAIFVAQSIAQINKKLFDAKGIAIKSQMAIQSRDIYAKNTEYKSGIKVEKVYSSFDKSNIFNNTEVVVDYYVYQAVQNEYPFESRSAILLKNQMVMFFELILDKLINLNDSDEDLSKMELPSFADYVPEDEDEDLNLINFSELNCSFLRSKGETLLSKLDSIKDIQNPIVSIKTDINNNYLSLISTKELEQVFTNQKVYRISCTKDTKYTLYGLLKQIVLAVRNITEDEIILNPELINQVTDNIYIQKAISLDVSTNVHPEDLKYSFYEAFSTFIRSIPFRAIFVIEDFHNTDETSLEILKYLIENNELGNVGFVVTNDTNWSLHRKIYRLMSCSNYLEIEMKPSANKTILATAISGLKKVQKSFFLEKILENTKGSYLYFNQALMYLVDENILKIEKSGFDINEERMILIPKDIYEVTQKRILHLKNHQNCFETYVSMLLMGEKISFSLLNRLNIENFKKVISYLKKEEFIRIIDENYVVIKNYNLFRSNLENICTPDILQQISQKLLDNIYINIFTPNKTKAELLEFAKLKREAFTQWHSIAMAASQLGDFCAYLNCTNRFLSLVDNVIDENTNKNVEEIKMDVYTELATMLYKYYPEKIISFLEMILKHFEDINDNAKIKEISNKLVQSCLISGNYSNALEYLGKIISRTKRSSFNPESAEFNLNYFLINLVAIEIYFNLGRLDECIDLGEDLFKHIDLINFDNKILPEGFSRKQFEDTLFDALFFINLARIIQLKPNAREKIEYLEQSADEYRTCFSLMLLLLDYFESKDIIPAMTEIAQKGLQDKYSIMLFPFLQGLISLKYQNWENFGNYIHNAKTIARAHNNYQFDYYCDLLIGYAYFCKNNIKKAKQIYYNVLDLASEKGLKNLIYITWFLISKLEAAENNFKLSENIISNTIMKAENDSNASELFTIIAKAFWVQIMLTTAPQKNMEKALFLSEQAFYGAVKSKLNIYLPKLADTLFSLYRYIVQSPQSQEVIEAYNKKIQNLQNSMNLVFPQLNNIQQENEE